MKVWKPTYIDRRHHALKLILDEPPPGRIAPYRDGEIAGMTGIAKATVRRLRRVTAEKQLMWPDVAHLSEAEWTRLLNRPSHAEPGRRHPDWASIHAQRQNRHTTIQQLWEEYRALSPSDALSYKRFSALYLRHTNKRCVAPIQAAPSAIASPNLPTAGRTLAPTTRKSP